MTTTCKTTTPSDEVILLTWDALASGETGDAAQAAQYPDKTLQASGTFTSFDLTGSLDGTNYALLHDNLGGALSITAPGLKMILENVIHIRPTNVVGAGAGFKVQVLGKSNT